MTENTAAQTAADALVAAADALRALADVPTVPAVEQPAEIKVGDRVRLIGDSNYGYKGDGKAATVERVDKNPFDSDQVSVKIDNERGSRLYALKNVALIPGTPKVGDMVKVVKPYFPTSGADLIGKTAKLIEARTEKEFVVEYLGLKRLAEVIEPATPAAEPEQPIKVGDRVRIVEVAPWIEFFSTSTSTSKGRTGTVKAVDVKLNSDPSVKGFTVSVDGLDDRRVGKVELLTEPAPIKVGDVVRIVRRPSALAGDRYVGSVGTVTRIAPFWSGFTDAKFEVQVDGSGQRYATEVELVTPAATPEPAPVEPERPADSFEVFDGDTVKFEMDTYGTPICVRVNDSVGVYVDSSELDDLITYLTRVRDYRKHMDA